MLDGVLDRGKINHLANYPEAVDDGLADLGIGTIDGQ
jgi:hypothetical protein